jgi:hypothetical protein
LKNKYDRENAKSEKEDAKEKRMSGLFCGLPNLLRVLLRALRAFAVAFRCCLIAQGYFNHFAAENFTNTTPCDGTLVENRSRMVPRSFCRHRSRTNCGPVR